MTHSEPRGTKLSASYFLTYFAVLLIPLIAALICYTESSRTIQTDIENENRALIRQAADILDMQLRELNDFGAQMVSNPTLTSLRYVDSPLEYPNIQYYFRMQSALPAQATLSSFLFDYFLFFNRGELALNDRFAYSYNDFYSLYMHSPGQTLEEWKQEVASVPLSSNTCSVRQIIYLNGDSNREMRLIEFTFSFLPFNSRDGQIVLYVDQQKFTDILASFRLENGDIAYIESAEKQVLASFGADDRAAELQGFLDGQSQNVDLIRAKVTGNRMLISRYRSAETGVGIAIARSADRAYARLYKVRWIIAGSLLIAVLLGMLFSFLFSLRNSAFIARLSPQLRGMSYGKAFQSLRKSFEDIRIANSTMERALASQQPYLQKSYLTQLLNGDFSNEENALAIARNIPSFKPKSPMRVVLLHFSGDSAFSGDTMDLQLSVNCKQVIRLAVESLEPDILRMSRSESDYVLLLCGEETEQRIERLVRLIRENLLHDLHPALPHRGVRTVLQSERNQPKRPVLSPGYRAPSDQQRHERGRFFHAANIKRAQATEHPGRDDTALSGSAADRRAAEHAAQDQLHGGTVQGALGQRDQRREIGDDAAHQFTAGHGAHAVQLPVRHRVPDEERGWEAAGDR